MAFVVYFKDNDGDTCIMTAFHLSQVKAIAQQYLVVDVEYIASTR